jgi:hypothetical protein
MANIVEEASRKSANAFKSRSGLQAIGRTGPSANEVVRLHFLMILVRTSVNELPRPSAVGSTEIFQVRRTGSTTVEKNLLTTSDADCRSFGPLV